MKNCIEKVEKNRKKSNTISKTANKQLISGNGEEERREGNARKVLQKVKNRKKTEMASDFFFFRFLEMKENMVHTHTHQHTDTPTHRHTNTSHI